MARGIVPFSPHAAVDLLARIGRRVFPVSSERRPPTAAGPTHSGGPKPGRPGPLTRRLRPAPTVLDDPTLPRIDIGGVALHAQLFGPSRAPLVVVLHGGPGGDYRSLLGLRGLADRHRLLFFDQRGAGLSQRVPAAALSLAHHLDEIDALIERFSPDRPAALIGHSWGASLATAYLGRHPEKISHAVLIEPGFLSAAGQRAWRRRARRYVTGRRMLGAAISALWSAPWLRPVDSQACIDYIWGRLAACFMNHPDNPYHCPNQNWSAPYWRLGARAARHVELNLRRSDADAIARHAGAFPGPVLLLAGACNHWLGEPLQRRHLPLFRDARLEIIAAAGHDIIWDNPEDALSAIGAFLRQAPPA